MIIRTMEELKLEFCRQFEKWRKDDQVFSFFRLDLKKFDLRKLKMEYHPYHSCIDLSQSDLSGADLRGANLYGADLSWAHLHGVDLRLASLNGCEMEDINVYSAHKVIVTKDQYAYIKKTHKSNSTYFMDNFTVKELES